MTNNKEHNCHLTYTDWSVIETQFDPTQLHHKETVFTLGNGYLGTRGSFEEGYPGSMSATLIHGVYDDVPVVHTELANCPDWLPLVVIINGDRFRLDHGEILSYRRQLDVRRGVLSRDVRWRSGSGYTVDIHLERFASLVDQHVLALRTQVTPLDFEGTIEVQASINGYPDNQGVMHWEWLNQGDITTDEGAQATWLHLRTRNSGIELGMATRLTVLDASATVRVTGCQGYPNLAATLPVQSGQTVTWEKVVTVFTSREEKVPAQAAQDKLRQVGSYASLLSAQEAAWEEVWQSSDVVIEGDIKAQLAIRYNLFQVLISAPRHDDTVSIPAKTLSGFAYRGHVFWDTEIFVLPFLIFTQPALARNLLTYRYHTLNGARRKAKESGYKGAVFAWESANTGDEVTPRWVPPADNSAELVRIWCGDRELHINTDVAYAVWNYWQATGDDDWMRDYGAELILDTAVYWGSRVEWNAKQEHYEIREVIGTDEYHEHVSNNTFTNRMVQWHLEKALAVLEWLHRQYPDQAATLEDKLQITLERQARWRDIISHIWISYNPETRIIEQFEGFFNLEDINLADYEPRTRSMQAILGIEGASKRQVLKQPDVLMLLYLLRDSLGSDYDHQTLQKNWDYYAPRTDITYGSSLGPAIQAALASYLNQAQEAYERFMQAALVDLEDTRRNAKEGIHSASAGGVWQAIVFGFAGIRINDAYPQANPHLPEGWTRLKFKLQWRGQWYEFDLHSEKIGELSGKMTEYNNPKVGKASAHVPNIQGVIFDLDGVLTETAEYHYRGWQRLADEEGIPFDRQANEAMRGLSRQDSLLQMLGDRSRTEEQFQEMMERKNRYYLEFIKDVSPADLLPGAVELLDELRSAGIKVAIGSASKNAQEVIQRLGIGDRVDTISDGYSVTRSKPAPDLFLHAANQLGLAPEHCVVVEDAASGVEAALAAGMWAVGLGPVERVGTAHVVLPSLAGVHWSDLLAKLSQSSSSLQQQAK
ncbi:MAG: beta-phosphoglucomutase [Coleofasciculus sp. C3-bin4]|nr:beta-phosphoglucomutase [Coleofasciculus sp. C3-bin4]